MEEVLLLTSLPTSSLILFGVHVCFGMFFFSSVLANDTFVVCCHSDFLAINILPCNTGAVPSYFRDSS